MRLTTLCDAIENDIVTGCHGWGERLDEQRLAARHGVSRTPIREALRHLAAGGLVVLRPNRGAFVAQRGVGDLVEMFEVMAELEAMCARLAARRITPDRLAALQAAHRACLDTGDADGYYYANEAFHQQIYAAAGNAFLQRQALDLHRQLKPYRRLQLRVPGRIAGSRAEHQAIVDAIAAADPAAAQAAMQAHVVIQGSRFSDFIAAVAGTGALAGDRI